MITRFPSKKLFDENTSPYVKSLILQQRAGIPLNEHQIKRLESEQLKETVSMVQIPKNRKQNVSPKVMVKPDEVDDYDELDLDEILREMGYGDDEEMEEELDDLTDDFIEKNKDNLDNLKVDKNDFKHSLMDLGLNPFGKEVDLDEVIEEIMIELGDNEERWGYYGDDEIDVSTLSEKELRDLIYKVLSDRDDEIDELFEGVLNVGNLQFSSSLSTNNKTLVFIPRSSKMIDTIDNMKISKREIVDKIINVLKKKYRGLNFRPSHSYEGYGYGVDLDMYSLV